MTHAAGTRTDLKPCALTKSMICCVVMVCCQAVSAARPPPLVQRWAWLPPSRVLPRFQPGNMALAVWRASAVMPPADFPCWVMATELDGGRALAAAIGSHGETGHAVVHGGAGAQHGDPCRGGRDGIVAVGAQLDFKGAALGAHGALLAGGADDERVGGCLRDGELAGDAVGGDADGGRAVVAVAVGEGGDAHGGHLQHGRLLAHAHLEPVGGRGAGADGAVRLHADGLGASGVAELQARLAELHFGHAGAAAAIVVGVVTAGCKCCGDHEGRHQQEEVLE